jgi:DNA end-binding protein Ku
VARPYWSGQLQISLVSFGIHLFPATNPGGEIAFHLIDRRSGERIHHQNVTESGDPVDSSEIVKGYEYQKGKYVIVEPRELKQLRIESKRTIEITQFVNIDEIDLALFEKPYFVVPQDNAQAGAFAVVRKAMEEEHKAAIGEVAFAGREHLVAFLPAPGKNERGMMAYTLRYEEELRNSADYLSSIKSQAIDSTQLRMAKQLIETYSVPFDLAKFKDDYEAKVRELVKAKLKNKPLPLESEPPKKAKVINLMDALRQSLERTGAQRSKSTSTPVQSKNTGLRLVQGKSRRKKTAKKTA